MFSTVSYFNQKLFYHPRNHVVHELGFYHKIKTMLIFSVYIHVYGIDKKET